MLWTIPLTIVVLLVMAWLSGFRFPTHNDKSRSVPMEQGYRITRICDNYPMIVGADAYDKAYWSGEYITEGVADRMIPVGQKYEDERLN